MALSATDDRDMDRLADQLAGGKSLPVAASRCGFSIYRAEALFARICARLGKQAK